MNPWGISETAAALYAQALVWDDHSGFEPLPDADLGQLERWRVAGVDYLSINVGYDVMGWQETFKALAAFRAWLAAHGESYALTGTVAEIDAAKAAGKLAVAFDIEGMNALDGATDLIALYYDLGVRQMLFAYNRNNGAGGGCHDTDIGLTDFGRAVVAEMNRVGMVVDCSHTAYRSTMEAMEISTAPVIFSHSNPRALRDHERNIRDDQINACAETGGVIGVNGIGIFLGENDIRTATLADHVEYLAGLAGPAHVGISLDYAAGEAEIGSLLGSKPDIWPAGQGYDTPDMQFAAPEQLPELAETLLDRGWVENDVRGVLGGNFRRVAAEVWK